MAKVPGLTPWLGRGGVVVRVCIADAIARGVRLCGVCRVKSYGDKQDSQSAFLCEVFDAFVAPGQVFRHERRRRFAVPLNGKARRCGVECDRCACLAVSEAVRVGVLHIRIRLSLVQLVPALAVQVQYPKGLLHCTVQNGAETHFAP